MKVLIPAFVTACALLFCPFAARGQNANGLGWRWQNPLPQGNHLRDIQILDATTVVAVGDGGTILRTTDAGLTWLPQASGTYTNLWGVSFIDAATGIAVGSGGTVVRTTDAGATWNPIAIAAAGTLRGVKFLDSLHGIAVEDLGTIYRTSDGGLTWDPLVIPASIGLFGVHFHSPLHGIAVGMGGRIFGTTDGGTTWTPRASPTTVPLYAVFFPTPDFGVAVGQGGVILRTTDGGDNWSAVSLGLLIPFCGVAFGDSLHGIAVGLPGTNYHTTDGGLTWFTRPSGTPRLLWKASFIDSASGFAVGDNGTLLHTDDGGIHWEFQSGGTTNSLFGVSFASLSRGVAVGDVGTIILTTNAGTSWTQQGSGTSQTLWSVCLASVTTGTAVGSAGTILRTTNGGVTWLPQTSGTTVQLFGVSHSDASTALAVGGAGTILRTTNAGATWTSQSSGTLTGLNAVQMVSASAAFVAGGAGTILKTTNGGGTWFPLSTGSTAGLFGLSFTDAQNGTAVGSGGAVLRTTDGGTSWMTQSSGTTVTLNSVSFAGTTVGTAVGNGGMIIRTANAGVTWTQQAGGTPNSLMSVDLVDAVHGTAVGFSGTILYTDTGGEEPAPIFTVDMPSVDFGDVAVGSSRTDTVVVTNAGTALLSISQVTSDNSRFTVVPASALILAGNSRIFSITFAPVSTGPRAASLVFTSDADGSPDTVSLQGNGFVEGLGTYLTLPPDSLISRDPFTQRMLKPVKRGRALYPNWANLISEVFIQGGFQPRSSQSDSAGAMRVGIAWMGEVRPNKWKPRPDSAAVRCWVRLGRWNFSRSTGTAWTNIQKTLLDNTGVHTGIQRGFDATGVPGEPNRRPLVKQQTKLAPKKHSNRLFAELVALKFNIAASLLGKTPVGFGELLYQCPGNLCDTLSLVEIAAKADTMMTYWQGHAQAEYDSLYRAIYDINRAFAGPLDTLSFNADNELILDGAVDLSMVPFLRPGRRPAQRLQRTTTDVTDPSDFGEEDAAEETLPVAAKLYQNYPNPFNPETTIGFRLLEPSLVTMRVYDLLGREVMTLLTGEEMEEGYNEVRFSAEGGGVPAVASGVYFYRIDVQGLGDEGLRGVVTSKMVLLK